MAFTELFCKTTGNNLNGGGLASGLEPDDAAAFTFVSGNWVSSTGVFTAPGADLSAVNIDDFASVYINGATVGVFSGAVLAKDDTADTITISLTRKSGTPPADGTGNRTIKVGGAWKGPTAAINFPFQFAQTGMKNAAGYFPCVNFKGGTNYAITAAINQGQAGPLRFQGYTTTPHDGGKCVIDGGGAGASYHMLTQSGANCDILDLVFQRNGASGSSTGLIVSGTECFVSRCVFNTLRGIGLSITAGGGSGIVTECEAYLCGQGNSNPGFRVDAPGVVLERCISHDNAGSAVSGYLLVAGTLIDCISETNGFIGIDVTSTTTANILGCDLYNNVSDGIRLANAGALMAYIENPNLVKNGGYGINGSGAGSRNGAIFNPGFGFGTQANASGQTTGLSAMELVDPATYEADRTPWVDPANGDFRLILPAAIGTGRGSFTQTQAGYAGIAGYANRGAVRHFYRSPNARYLIGT